MGSVIIATSKQSLAGSFFTEKFLKVKKTKNKNLQKTIRSAIFNSNIEKNQFLYSDNEDTKYLMHSYDWISKKLFIDQGFDDTVLKKAVKILKIKKFKNTKVKKDFVWVYLEDLLPDQMIEYGEVLPKSGQEKKWFNSLTPSLRIRLRKMEKRK